MNVTRSKPKSLLGNAGWNVLSTGWFIAAGFLLTPFLIARLGTDQYGLYVLILSISGMLGIMDLGLGEATLRYVAFYASRDDIIGVNRTVGATVSIYAVTGVLGWALLFFSAPWVATLLALQPEDLDLAVALLRLTSINLGVMTVSGAYGAIPRALQRFDINTGVTLAQSLFQIVGTVAILLLGWGIYHLVLWTVVVTLFRQILNVVIARRLIPSLRLLPWPSRDGLREVFSYGVFATITRVLGMVWQEADRVLLGALVSAASVAYLSVPKNLVLRGLGATGGISAVLFPRFSATQDLQETRRLFLNAVWCMLFLTILLFVPITILLPDFLRLWIDEEFSRQSAQIGQIIAASCIVRGAFLPYQDLFRGLGKPKYLSVVTVGSGLTNLGVNLLLIPLFGLAGAGYAYTITVVWGFSALWFAWKKALASDSMRPFLRAVLLPILLALVGLGLSALIRLQVQEPGWVGLVLLGALFVSVTAGLVVGGDLLLGGLDSHACVLFRAVVRFLQSGPWKGLAKACISR